MFSRARRHRRLTSATAPACQHLESRQLLHGAVDVAVDFQPPGMPAAANFFVDEGLPFGERSDGLTYGWRRDAGPWLNSWTTTSQSVPTGDGGTWISAGWAADLRWELVLPAGRYRVTLVAGDAAAQSGQRFVAAMEEQVVLDFTATENEVFVTRTVEVDVLDGKLSLSAPDGLANTSFATVHVTATHHGHGGGGETGGEGGSGDGAAGNPVALGEAAPAIINFEDLSRGSIGEVYTHASGHRFRSLPGRGGTATESMWIRGVPEGYASNVLHSTNFGRKFMLDRPDGATFSLARFDYGAGRWPEAGDAIVTGFFAGGATASVTAKFTNRTLQTLALNWENLTRVEINHAGGMNDVYGAVDNFVVSAGGGDDGDEGGGDGSGEGAHQETNGRVDIEAEASTGDAAGTGAAAGSAWTAFTEPTASGGSGVAALPNSGLNVGDSTIGARRDYAINFTTPGTYYFWVRLSGGNGSDDSIHAGLDGTPMTFGGQGITLSSAERGAGWVWKERNSGGGRVALSVGSTGVRTLNLWMREDGAKVDRFILSNDPAFDPANDTSGGDDGGGGDDSRDGTVSMSGWTIHGNMPVQMIDGTIAELNGTVYLWGGFDNGWTWLSQTHGYRFNTATSAWTRIADLPAPLTHAQAVTHDGRIYFFGGYANNGSVLGNSDKVWMYDPATNKFSHWGTIPYAISGHGAAKVGSRVHLLGGYLRDSQNNFIRNSTRHVSIDLANAAGGWRDEPDVPAGRDHVASEHVDGGIYYLGGQWNDDEFSGVRSEMWRYDLATRTWSAAPGMPDGGRGHIDQASGVYAGRILSVAGNVNGTLNSNYSDEVFLYDPRAQKWSILGTIPEWRRGAHAAVIGDRLWVFGGGTSYPRNNVWSGKLSVG